MISNSKDNCKSDVIANIRRAATWRRALRRKFEHDNRLLPAAEALDHLARQASEMTDDEWARLSKFYHWSSQAWSDAVSQTTRLVGFRPISSFAEFVDRLVKNLSQNESVAA
jgi:hypothetical protein